MYFVWAWRDRRIGNSGCNEGLGCGKSYEYSLNSLKGAIWGIIGDYCRGY